MSLLTSEQLDQIDTHFGLQKVPTLPVRDGIVNPDQYVWWRCEYCPEHVRAKDHWSNIQDHPECYQLSRPLIKYED